MSKLYDTVKAKVIDKLVKMKDVTILDGWLDLFIADFLSPSPVHRFPAVFVQYQEDGNQRNVNTVDNKCTRTLQLTGAIMATGCESVNSKLDDLLLKVKSALVATDPSVIITIPKVTFAVAETRDYALFNATLVIVINEKWEI